MTLREYIKHLEAIAEAEGDELEVFAVTYHTCARRDTHYYGWSEAQKPTVRYCKFDNEPKKGKKVVQVL